MVEKLLPMSRRVVLHNDLSVLVYHLLFSSTARAGAVSVPGPEVLFSAQEGADLAGQSGPPLPFVLFFRVPRLPCHSQWPPCPGWSSAAGWA